jgi:hypothetical protein
MDVSQNRAGVLYFPFSAKSSLPPFYRSTSYYLIWNNKGFVHKTYHKGEQNTILHIVCQSCATQLMDIAVSE